MKCQSKIDVSIIDYIGKEECLLIMGKMYECKLTTITSCLLGVYNPTTFKPDKPSYIVECEDGRWRRYNMEHFVDLQEAREEKLKELGI